jgi:phage-related minor tail protein
MGEAGPEAVMPLKRTKDGKLGVVSETVSGSQGPEMKVIINNNSDSKVTAKQSDDGMTLEVMVEQIENSLTKRMSRGSGLAGYMDSRYGRRG